MPKKKENAIARIKVFPKTQKKLKILAAQRGFTMAELIDSYFFGPKEE